MRDWEHGFTDTNQEKKELKQKECSLQRWKAEGERVLRWLANLRICVPGTTGLRTKTKKVRSSPNRVDCRGELREGGLQGQAFQKGVRVSEHRFTLHTQAKKELEQKSVLRWGVHGEGFRGY
jgi:hypothetical protein